VARKKTNPRRIPIARKDIDTNAVVEEAMKDDLIHAWLLTADALISLEHINPDELSGLADAVNRYIEKGSKQGKEEIVRAEKIVATKKPRVNPNYVRSPYDLEKFKKKVERIALQTGLCVICLGLESTGKFSEDDLKRIFFAADLTLAEIDSGVNSYENIQNELLKKVETLEMLKDV